jgi:phosphoserine phosphatase
LADAEAVKKSFIASILKGQSRYQIEKKAQQFFDENYPVYSEKMLWISLKILTEHTESYIVSASLDIWVKPFADKLNMILLATKQSL